MFFILRTTNKAPVYFSNMESLNKYLSKHINNIDTSGALTRIDNIIIDKVATEIPDKLPIWIEEQEPKKLKEKKPRKKFTDEEKQEKFNIEIQKLEERLKKKKEQYDKFQKKQLKIKTPINNNL